MSSKYNDDIALTVHATLERYFGDLKGESPSNIYDMLLAKVEKPLLEVVLSHTKGNQTSAATILGINRSTLRKKLKAYNMDSGSAQTSPPAQSETTS